MRGMPEAEVKERKAYIYAIKNRVNGKVYIGSTLNFENRFHRHRTDLQSGTHHSRYLQRAWDKYGKSAFSFFVLETVSSKCMLSREQAHLDRVGRSLCYNVAYTAGNCLGVKQSAATRSKRSLWMRGKICTAETRAKISAKAKARGTPKSAALLVAHSKAKKYVIDPERALKLCLLHRSGIRWNQVAYLERTGVKQVRREISKYTTAQDRGITRFWTRNPDGVNRA